MSNYQKLAGYVIESYASDLLKQLSTISDYSSNTDYESCTIIGIGGSGIVGAYWKILAEPDWKKPISTANYEKPSFPERAADIVIAVSYSGSTYETIQLFKSIAKYAKITCVISGQGELLDIAHALGSHVRLVTGAPAPRFGLAMMLGATASLFCSLVGDLPVRLKLENAARKLRERLDDSATKSLVKSIVGFVGSSYPVVYGSGYLLPVAYRWKTQFNENAKIPAFCGELPECNHNEINAWESEKARQDFCGIMLSGECSESETAIFQDTYRDASGLRVLKIGLPAADKVEETLMLTAVGDLASIALAQKLGNDPLKVDVIEKAKRVQREMLNSIGN